MSDICRSQDNSPEPRNLKRKKLESTDTNVKKHNSTTISEILEESLLNPSTPTKRIEATSPPAVIVRPKPLRLLLDQSDILTKIKNFRLH